MNGSASVAGTNWLGEFVVGPAPLGAFLVGMAGRHFDTSDVDPRMESPAACNAVMSHFALPIMLFPYWERRRKFVPSPTP